MPLYCTRRNMRAAFLFYYYSTLACACLLLELDLAIVHVRLPVPVEPEPHLPLLNPRRLRLQAFHQPQVLERPCKDVRVHVRLRDHVHLSLLVPLSRPAAGGPGGRGG